MVKNLQKMNIRKIKKRFYRKSIALNELAGWVLFIVFLLVLIILIMQFSGEGSGLFTQILNVFRFGN